MDQGRPSPYLAHDVLVVIVAAALLVAGWLAHGAMTRPELATLDRHGLTLQAPRGWLPSGAPSDTLPAETSWQPVDEPNVKLEVRVQNRPAFDGPLQPLLDLARGRRYGELYKRLSVDDRVVGGRTWLRSRYTYAFKPTEDDAPMVASAVEYALVNGDKLYVVTVHGPDDRVEALEASLLRTLKVR